MGRRICLVLVAVVAVEWAPLWAAVAAPPSANLHLVAASQSVEPGDPVTIFVSVTNGSDAKLVNLVLSIHSDAFTRDGDIALPDALAPFSTVIKPVALRAATGAGIGQHTLLFALSYGWTDDGQLRTSTIVASVALGVKHPLEDEAKGFPGGTAALLVLLLPVIPAFLSYQLIEQLRTRQPLQVPVFRAEHVPFAFFVAITVGVLRLSLGRAGAVATNDPAALVVVILVSAAIGAVLPATWWIRGVIQASRWSFRPTDDAVAYLRKSLLGPHRSGRHLWVKGSARGQGYTGVQLTQPNGRTALGARLQVSPGNGLDRFERERVWQTLLSQVIAGDGRVRDARRLVAMVRDRTLTVQFQERILVGDAEQGTFVLTEGLDDWKEQASEEKPIVTAVP